MLTGAENHRDGSCSTILIKSRIVYEYGNKVNSLRVRVEYAQF